MDPKEKKSEPDEDEPFCSACAGDESPYGFHTYTDGCDRRFDP